MAKENNRRAVLGWAMYDWANSVFATTVMAGFFPVFFKQYWSHGADVNLSTAQLGFGNSIAALIVALMAPVLGAIADKGSAQKWFLAGFTYLGVAASAGLFFISRGQWEVAILVYAVGTIGFSGGNIFYDSLLPTVAPAERIDYVSSLGYSLGYLGGGLLFLINVMMTIKPTWFGLADAGAAVRVSFLTVAVWWGGFALFTLHWVKEKPAAVPGRVRDYVRAGIGRILATVRKIRLLRNTFLFLFAYWFYIDGVGTIIRMAVDYGMSLGFATMDLIVALLIVQFVGFPMALVFGVLGQRWGAQKAIFLGVFIYMGVTLWGTGMTHRYEFYILAVIIGMVQGGVQALSRSYFSRLIPRNQAAEFYGFFNMLGKFAAIVGPALMGVVGLTARWLLMPAAPSPQEMVAVGHLATRWSLGSVTLLFAIGLALFYFVDEEKGRAEIARFESGTE
jgi:MFS transporter, UMF1 family